MIDFTDTLLKRKTITWKNKCEKGRRCKTFLFKNNLLTLFSHLETLFFEVENRMNLLTYAEIKANDRRFKQSLLPCRLYYSLMSKFHDNAPIFDNQSD